MRIVHDISEAEAKETKNRPLQLGDLLTMKLRLRQIILAGVLLSLFGGLLLLSVMSRKLFLDELMTAGGIVLALLFFRNIELAENTINENNTNNF